MFTAVGVVAPGAIYQTDMGAGFRPFRRSVLWSEAVETPVRPLISLLAFTRDRKTWGYQFRFGLFEITREDMQIISAAMRAGVC